MDTKKEENSAHGFTEGSDIPAPKLSVMKIFDFLNSKIIKKPELDYNFNLVKELNIDAVHHNGCLNCNNKHNQQNLPAEPWTGLQYCSVCNSLNLIYFSDRMGGNYTDTVRVYQEK